MTSVRPALLGTGFLILASTGLAALAADPAALQLTIRDHRFEPAELRAPAGVPIVITVKNEDSTAEEFDSSALRAEKVVPGGREGTVRLQPLQPGRYPFEGEFHSSTAKGVLIVEKAQ